MTDAPTGWEGAIAPTTAPEPETPAPADPEDTAPKIPDVATGELMPLNAMTAPVMPAETIPDPAPEPEPVFVDVRQKWLCVTPEGTRTISRADDEEKPSICPPFHSDAHLMLPPEYPRCPHCGGISVVKEQDWIAGRQKLGLPA